MSDIVKGAAIISLGDCSNMHLHYVHVLKQCESGNEVLFWLNITLKLLDNWRRDMFPSLKAGIHYIDLVKASILGDAFCLDCESVNWKNSCVKFAENKSKLVNKKGSLNQRQTFLEKCTKIAVWKNDIIPVEVWQSEVGSLVQKLEVAEAHVEEWKQKYADIEKVLFLEILVEKELNSACREEYDNMKKI